MNELNNFHLNIEMEHSTIGGGVIMLEKTEEKIFR